MNQPREVVADAVNKIQDEISAGRMSAPMVFTKMRELIAATQPGASAGVELSDADIKWHMRHIESHLIDADAAIPTLLQGVRKAIAAALRTPAASVGDVGRVVGYANRNEFAAEGSAGFTCSKRPPLTDSSFFTIPLYTTTPPTQQDARAVDDTARLDWLSRSSNLQNEIVQHGYGSLRHRIDAALAAPRAGDTAQDSGQG